MMAIVRPHGLRVSRLHPTSRAKAAATTVTNAITGSSAPIQGGPDRPVEASERPLAAEPAHRHGTKEEHPNQARRPLGTPQRRTIGFPMSADAAAPLAWACTSALPEEADTPHRRAERLQPEPRNSGRNEHLPLQQHHMPDRPSHTSRYIQGTGLVHSLLRTVSISSSQRDYDRRSEFTRAIAVDPLSPARNQFRRAGVATSARPYRQSYLFATWSSLGTSL